MIFRLMLIGRRRWRRPYDFGPLRQGWACVCRGQMALLSGTYTARLHPLPMLPPRASSFYRHVHGGRSRSPERQLKADLSIALHWPAQVTHQRTSKERGPRRPRPPRDPHLRHPQSPAQQALVPRFFWSRPHSLPSPTPRSRSRQGP